MSDSPEYTQISIAAVRALAQAGTADFEVFLPGTTDHSPILYRAAEAGLSEPDFARMAAHGVSSLFVHSKDYHRCETTLESSLDAILANRNITTEDKAKVVHSVGSRIARDLIEKPAGKSQLDRTSAIVDQMINTVLNDPLIAASLLEMAGHERSTASHMFVVSTLAVLLGAETFGDDVETLRSLGFAGMLHDIGKLSIGTEILNKPTPLTQAEVELVHQHPIESVRLIGDNPHLTPVIRQMILQHHERIDGRGYPLGLRGEDLLPGSKLLSIVDSFHAMIGHRSYRTPLTPCEANRVLATQAGKQFDSQMLECWTCVFEGSWSNEATERTRKALTVPDELSPRHEHRPTPPARKNTVQRQPRFECHGRTTVQCIYAGRLSNATAAPDEFAALAHDVSRGGLCIYAAHPMYRCEIVHIRIKLQEEFAWLRASVAWCRRQDACVYRIGLRFMQRVTDEQARESCSVNGLDNLKKAKAAPWAKKDRRTTTRRKTGLALANSVPIQEKRDSALRALAAIAAMRKVGESDQNTTITLAMSDDSTVRLKAVEVLANIDSRAAHNTLVSLLDDSEAEIREQATMVAGALKLQKAAEPLRRLLDDSQPTIALRAAGALGKLDCTDGMRLVVATLEGRGPNIRLAALMFGEITGHRFGANKEGVASARRYLSAKRSILVG